MPQAFVGSPLVAEANLMLSVLSHAVTLPGALGSLRQVNGHPSFNPQKPVHINHRNCRRNMVDLL